MCTANSARSHLAAALWRRASTVPAVSAGTLTLGAIDPGALEVAKRHGLPLPRRRPRHLVDVLQPDDLVVTVCDLAHEELSHVQQLHWSVSDPVRQRQPAAFDTAFTELAERVDNLARRIPQPA